MKISVCVESISGRRGSSGSPGSVMISLNSFSVVSAKFENKLWISVLVFSVSLLVWDGNFARFFSILSLKNLRNKLSLLVLHQTVGSPEDFLISDKLLTTWQTVDKERGCDFLLLVYFRKLPYLGQIVITGNPRTSSNDRLVPA